jgi:16S rRNA (guanine527-N7)-methyltransferase
VDNGQAVERLREGADRLGITLRKGAEEEFFRLQGELLRWNAKVNLTAITDPMEVIEKHLLDSVAVLPEVEGARSMLDVGAGAGFPGLVLKLQRPDLQLTLVESVGKKVSFLKHIIVTLKLGQTQALQLRAGGNPGEEKVPLAEVVISRALTELDAWLPLAKPYVLPGGRVLAMLGQAPNDEVVHALAQNHGYRRWTLRRYALPFSGAQRAVGSFWPEG